jgi:hypothetical protein
MPDSERERERERDRERERERESERASSAEKEADTGRIPADSGRIVAAERSLLALLLSSARIETNRGFARDPRQASERLARSAIGVEASLSREREGASIAR